jgi:dipeptidyl aminopeptidase/acylaminoacyl peptidase
MNESMDQVLADWLHEGPESGPREGLERSLAATRRIGQRPGWTLPERWIPMELAMARTRVQRPMLAIVMLVLLTAAVVAAALFVGARPQQPPLPFRNGVIALAKDGDIFVADRPGGDLRPLVAGPGNDQSPMFSPDGTRLAFVRDDGQGSFLMVADADGTNAVQIPLEPFLDTSLWSFAPDGRSLMTVAQIDGAKRVVIRPVDPAAALTVLDIRLPASWMYIEDPRFHPTNPQEILVVAQLVPDGPRGLYVYDLATGAIRTIVEPADGFTPYVDDVAWLPDGEHIIYSLGGDPHVVAADGSGDQALDALKDRISPLSNDGTRIVVDVGVADVPGDDSHQRSVVVPIDGEGERVKLACGLGMKIECAWSWIWSPDDSMLIGTVPHETSSTYLQADPDTGRVTELDWVDVGTPAWQRAP